jgi:hypothetical protein
MLYCRWVFLCLWHQYLQTDPTYNTATAWVLTEYTCYTYLLTPYSTVLLEKLTGLQLVQTFPAFYGTRRFITAFTRACHLALSWASPIQFIPPPPPYHFSRPPHRKAWAQPGIYKLASAVWRQHVGDLPMFSFFRLPRRVPRSLSEAHHSVKL